MAKITAAGLALIAQLQADVETLVINKMIYANIDGLNPNVEPPDTEVKPSVNDIVRESVIADAGYVDPNTVVYSDVLDATIGDFEFNWIGLFCTEHNTLIAVTYVPLQSKRATAGFDIGNTLCKNFAINFTDIQDLTGIVIQAATWQQDFGAAIESYTKALIPAGTTIIVESGIIPDGYLSADGSAVSRVVYTDLFAAIGTTFGIGDGATTFNIPDYTSHGVIDYSGYGAYAGGFSANTDYVAPTDLIVTCHSLANDHQVFGKVNGITVVADDAMFTEWGSLTGGVTFPVKKGDTWQITCTATTTIFTVSNDFDLTIPNRYIKY